MKTSKEWWQEVKSDPERMDAWLRRQYVGEIAAVNLLSELLIRHGSEATPEEWDTVHKIMCQEATHGKWIKRVMDARGIKPEPDGDPQRRYWAEVRPHVNSFVDGMAAGFHAESMRLERIRTIVEDEDVPADIRKVFSDILPHEEWHEEAFDAMRQGRELSRYHERGLQALNLVLA
jgi:hypothetical protein